MNNAREIQKQIELRQKIETYYNELDKLSKLYPCKNCGKVKYVIGETSVEKACESECEYLKNYIKTVEEHKSMLIRNLGLVEPKQ